MPGPRPIAGPRYQAVLRLPSVIFIMLMLALTVAGYVARPLPRDSITPTAWNQKIDLNRADEATLELLPGIGPGIAAAIADHRRAHGSFAAASDLLKVKGIGPRTLERIERYVTCAPATTAARDAKQSIQAP